MDKCSVGMCYLTYQLSHVMSCDCHIHRRIMAAVDTDGTPVLEGWERYFTELSSFIAKANL